MNQSHFATLLLFAATAVSANAQMTPDTVITVESPNSIMVIKNGKTTSVSISGTKNNPAFRFDYNVTPDSTASEQEISLFPFTPVTHPARNRVSTGISYFHDLYAGAVVPITGSDVFNTSWEIGIGRVAAYRVSKASSQFAIGLGFGYRRFNVGHGLTFDKPKDCLQLTAAPEEATDLSSRINSWAIHIPLTFSQRLFKSIGFNAGVVCNFNFYTSVSSSFHIDEKRITMKTKGLHQRILTPDIYLGIGSVNNFGLYFRWSPVSHFKSTFGPDIRFVSIGGSIAF